MPESTRPSERDPEGARPIDVMGLLSEWVGQAASLRVVVRDGEGRFLATGAVGGRDAGFFGAEERRGVIGATQWPTMRYLDSDGREMRLLDHPAHVARVTGEPQIGKMIGLRAPDGEMRWYIGDYIPMRPNGSGFQVISVVMDVTEARLARSTAEARATALEVLLDTSARLSRAPRDLAVLAAELREAFEAVAPRTHSAITRWDTAAREMRGCMVAALPGMVPVATTTLVPQEVRTFLARSHVNNDLQLTDIYGTRVIGADEVPARSVCVVPVTVDSELVGAVSAFSQSAGFFEAERVDLLERLARVVAPSLAAIASYDR